MYCIIFLASLLAAAAANPVDVQRRALPIGYGGLGGGYGSAVSQQDQASSSQYASGYTTGVGPFGMGSSGYSESSQSSYSSSYTAQSFLNTFDGIGGQIASMQSLLASGGMTQGLAMQQMSALASSFQGALGAGAGCGCFGADGVLPMVGGVFSQFCQMLMTMQTTFGSGYGSIISPFAGLGSSFQSFFQQYSLSGYQSSQIIPTALPGLLGPAISNFGGIVGGV